MKYNGKDLIVLREQSLKLIISFTRIVSQKVIFYFFLQGSRKYFEAPIGCISHKSMCDGFHFLLLSLEVMEQKLLNLGDFICLVMILLITDNRIGKLNESGDNVTV